MICPRDQQPCTGDNSQRCADECRWISNGRGHIVTTFIRRRFERVL